ncbi:hypothetical protein B0H14DRAFT_2814660 [Mycena olivaceomarginata]|nr:hypothetical protein B0H14DRAFT_2814660 [Mycena olivaceomarginata]
MSLSIASNSPGNDSHSTQIDLHPQDGTQAQPDALITSFMFFQIFGGHLGIPIILLTTALSKTIQRRAILTSFLVTWVIYTMSYTLLLYTGTQTGPEPPIQLCITQAALIYGAPVMTSAAGLAFVLHLWFSLRTGTPERWHMLLLLTTPYILFVAFSITMGVIGSLNPETISRSQGLYCSTSLPMANAPPALTALIMSTVIVFQTLVCIRLYRHRRAFQNMARPNVGGTPLDLFVRVGIFGAYSFLAVIAAISFWAASGSDLPYFIIASLPTAAFFVFGMHADLLRAWGIAAAARFIFRAFLCRSRSETSKSRTLPDPYPFNNSRRRGVVDDPHGDFLQMDAISDNGSRETVQMVKIH